MAQFSRSQGVIMCQNPLCLRDISYSFLPMAFKFSHMVIIEKTLRWLTFCDHGSIIKVTGVIMFQTLTFFMQYFLVFSQWFLNSQFSVTMDKTLNWLTFCDYASICKVIGGCYVSKWFILLCNWKSIDTSTFAGHTLLGYFFI